MLIITVLALLMAATMGWLAMRLLREEQRRSEARIAALAAAIEQPDSVDEPTRGADVVPARPSSRGERPQVAVAMPPHEVRRPRPEIVPIDSTSSDTYFHDEAPSASWSRSGGAAAAVAGHQASRLMQAAERSEHTQTVHAPHADAAVITEERALFSEPRPATADDRRWLGMAAVVVACLLGGAALWGLGGSTGAASATPASAAAAPAGIPLELVGLGHDQAGKDLVVRGLVRNPTAASTRTGTAVSVFLFDETGGFLGSGRGAVDVPALRAGEEAAFEVTMPADARVRRYRVTFRGADGAVVPHVDKRALR